MSTLDPIVLFFLLGLAAGIARADLRLPPAIYEFLSILLLLSIGLKGGVELARQPFGALLPQMYAVVLMGSCCRSPPIPCCVSRGASSGPTRPRSPPTTVR